MTLEVTVRRAVPEDSKCIRGLIQELADYEKMPNGPKISAEDLQNHLFPGEKKCRYSCLVAENSAGDLIGFTLYYPAWSFMGHSYYIEDLYVQPSSRRTGVGLKIFKEIAKDAIENNAKKLFFSVLNWNEPAINFYKKLGALDYTADMTLDIYRFTRPAMETLVNADVENLKADPEVSVRSATKKDCSVLHKLIQDFMDFLNVKEDLFPIEDLEKYAFSEADDFLTTIQISIAERGQTAIGYAMAFPNFSTWQGPASWLENLYIVPEGRGKGLGKQLVKHAIEVAMREPCARMDLVANTLDPLARNLYTGQGAINLTKEEGWHWFKLQRPEIEKLYSD